jgi:hypothetical protein
MEAVDLNTKLINGYLELLKNLSPANKLDLIAKLTQSVKADLADKDNAFEQAFGAWDKSENTEEPTNTFDFSWEGGLEELRTKFDSVQLQHHINEIR